MKIDLTKQEMFDIAYNGIVNQGKPGIDSGGDCVYQGPDGSMCAVGLIFDAHGIGGLRNLEGDVLEAASALDLDLTGEQIDFMDSMQTAHDSAAQTGDILGFMDRFRFNMSMMAEKLGLSIPSVT